MSESSARVITLRKQRSIRLTAAAASPVAKWPLERTGQGSTAGGHRDVGRRPNGHHAARPADRRRRRAPTAAAMTNGHRCSATRPPSY